MKTIKHNLFGIILLCASMVYSQTKTQKYSESFDTKKDVIVEIDVSNSDVVVEYWNKNEVLVETILSIAGVTDNEADDIFNSWEIEALGNSSKVVISSKPSLNFDDMNFSEMAFVISDMNFSDFNFDFEPLVAYSLNFDSVSFPTPPEMPAVAIKVLRNIEWDQEAYEKDKEKYLKEFEKQHEAWSNEIEEKYEPLMEQYEEEMEKWSEEFAKKYEPKMKEYEKEMEKWQKDYEKKLAPQLKKLEEKMAVQEKEIEAKMKKIEVKFEAKHENLLKMKKRIMIKIPKDARVKVRNFESTVDLPKGVKRA